ncbi:hypothetical protein ACI79D_21485 [Geodermatophilus sp. SYSU D00708]
MRRQHHATSPLLMPPLAMPVLQRGRHRDPSQGACFMEYTALLAGEEFTDEPRCVDADLALVLRIANDRLPDADRHRLVPLLGRAIGLRVERPVRSSGRGAWRLHLRRLARHRDLTAQLRRRASARFMAALGVAPTPATRLLYGDGECCASLFWDLVDDPPPDSSESSADRIVDRLRLLHECYELALDDLGLERAPTAGPAAERPAPSAPRAEEVPG